MSPLPSAPEGIVVNTGPLIALGRIGAFEFVGRLPLQFFTSLQVANEIAVGAKAGHPVALPSWVTVHELAGGLVPLAQ